jgi:threonine/homoserine/homoserine lactone efflux protein
VTPTLLSYISVTFFLVITPGATTAVVIQQTLRHGHRGGAAAALGAALGNTTHALAAGLGLAVILHRWPQASTMLRILGGLYLCFLGAQSLRRAWFRTRSLEVDAVSGRSGRGSDMRQGLTVTLLNPSIATFYLAVLPAFLDPSGGFQSFAPLAAIHISMAFSCHLIWALALDSLRHRLATPAGLRVLDAAAGLALLILGLGMFS